MSYTMNEIKDRLLEEGYKEQEIKILTEQYMKADPCFEVLIRKWLDGGEIGDIEIEGWHLKKLEKTFQMNFTAALLTLDWLKKDPKAAKEAIAYGTK